MAWQVVREADGGAERNHRDIIGRRRLVGGRSGESVYFAAVVATGGNG